MKTYLMCSSRQISLFMFILLLSMPFFSLAQQEGLITLQAQNDARKDYTKQSLIGAAFGVPSGIMLGCIAGNQADQISSGWDDFLAPAIIALLTATATISFTTLISIHSNKISPERFVGKSPEYVNTYTQSYNAKYQNSKRRARIFLGCAGCLSGLAAVGGYIDLLID